MPIQPLGFHVLVVRVVCLHALSQVQSVQQTMLTLQLQLNVVVSQVQVSKVYFLVAAKLTFYGATNCNCIADYCS